MIPVMDAAVVDASLVECAEKVEVSIPAERRVDFSRRAMVEETTGLCGFLMLISSWS